MPSRREVLEKWLLEGGCICPFARTTGIVWAEERNWAEGAKAFSQTYSVKGGEHTFIIVAEKDEDFEKAKTWSTEFFLKLYAFYMRMLNMPKVRIDQVVSELREMFKPEDPRYPFLAVKGDDNAAHPAYVIGMGPQYKEGDPRWAPVTCLVTTWMHEVQAADDKASQFIRAKMKELTGKVYGADIIWRDYEVK